MLNSLIRSLLILLCPNNTNRQIFITNIYIYLLFISKNGNHTQINGSINLNTFYNYFSNEFFNEIKSKFNFDMYLISFDEFEILINSITDFNTLFNSTNTTLNINELIYDNLLTIKELKSFSKEFKSFFTRQTTINHINKIINDLDIKHNKSILNLFSGTGGLLNGIVDSNTNTSNLSLYDINHYMNIISHINILITKNIDLTDKIFKTDILHDNIFKVDETFDFIIADLPTDLKNIIHAECCSKIKKYRIRGTKAEPLFLQLIMSLLNKHGTAIIVVPDSLLFCDSNQHTETRKFLVNNFNLQHIFNIEDKKSILVFSSGKTNNVSLNNLDNNISINLDQIKNKNFSFFFNHFNTSNNLPISSNTSFKFKDVVNIVSDNFNTIYTDTDFLICHKTNNIIISKLNNDIKPDLVFVSKDSNIYNQSYLNHYLHILLKTNFNNIVRGKTKQFDIDLIYDLDIIIPPIHIQLLSIEFFESNLLIIDYNLKQIHKLELLKNNFIQHYINDLSKDKLINLCTISHESNAINTIMIHKNSNMAGTIEFTTNIYDNSTNNYYLIPDENKINKLNLFYLLKYNENLLKDLSKVSNTINLSRSKLENLDIHIFPTNNTTFVDKCSDIDSKIKQFEKFNSDLSLILYV